jgi:hypothetical protein
MITYIENFYSPEEADALFNFIRELPFVRPRNMRNSTSRLRRLSFPGYSPPLSHRSVNHKAGYDVRGIVEDAPQEYKTLAARFSEYAASVQLPTPINYLSTIGYLVDDYMNFHQHAEDQKREDQTVYLLSLGAVHPISIRSGYTGPKPNGKRGTTFIPDGKDDYIIYPKHGSLYVLPDSFNRPGSGDEHQHAVLDGNDDSYGGLRISINCKHVPPGLSPEEMRRACSRPAGRSQSQDSNLLMNSVKGKTGVSSSSSPRVCWGSREDFPDAVYVGRKNTRGKFRYEESQWGNFNAEANRPFREYAEMRMRDPVFAAETYAALRGKDLLCPWCKPGDPDCHALVWLELNQREL